MITWSWIRNFYPGPSGIIWGVSGFANTDRPDIINSFIQPFIANTWPAPGLHPYNPKPPITVR